VLVAGLSLSPLATVLAPAAFASAASQSSGAPIVVGGVVSASTFPGTNYGFEAGIRQFNAAGGLGGRKIKFLGVQDDAANPSTTYSDVQTLVESDHIFALAPYASVVGSGSVGAFLASKQVPFMGYALNGSFLAAPTWGFGVNGQQANPSIDSDTNDLNFAQGLGIPTSKVKLALIGNDVPGSQNSLNSEAAIAKKIGEDVVYSESPIPNVGVTSYAPYAEGIINSGANEEFTVGAENTAVGLDAALKADHWKGTLVNGVSYGLDVANQPNTEAALNDSLVTNQFPVNQDNTPAVKQEEKELKAIGQPTTLTAGVSVGYWTAQEFIQALEATEKSVGAASKVTSAALQKRVNSGWTYTDTLSGGVGSLTFPKDETQPSGCGTILRQNGNSFKMLVPYRCPPNGVYIYSISSSGQVTKQG
jgi:branched-chain amino acid transport system substrate-binding protein